MLLGVWNILFKMTLNQKDGILLISYTGYFTIYDAKLFQRELELKLRNIKPEEYVLVIDSHDVRLSTQELAPLLDEIQKTYMDAPFRYILSVEEEGWLAAKLRQQRDCRRGNWLQVATVDEALLRVKKGMIPQPKDAGHD